MTIDRIWEASYPDSLRGYHLESTRIPKNAVEIATRSRVAHGDRPAFTLVLPNGASASASFREIDARSDDFAAFLINDLGLQPGDVVAIQMPNSLHYPIAVLGAWKAGAVVTNVNPLYTERETTAQLQDCDAKVLVATGMSMKTIRAAAKACGAKIVQAGLWEFFPDPVAQAIQAKLSAAADAGSLSDLPHVTFPEALKLGRQHGSVQHRHHPIALYQYTGGTTGRSKGAIITHQNILSVLTMTDDFLDAYGAPFVPTDVVLTALPLYHIFAFVINFLVFFRTGARNILIPNPRPLENLRPAFEQFGITWMTGVDTLYAGLLDETWFRENPPTLKYALSGGTALRPSTAQRWGDAVCPILEGYGMTESTCIISFNPPGRDNYNGSVGIPMPGSDMKVVNDRGDPVPPGERGELLVRGPHITSGYLNQPDENATAFADGWFRTGDVVTMQANGYITIVDRLKDMLLVSGFNVYPNEVEAVIAAHPDVVEVAVIGVSDDVTGEAVCACIVSRTSDLTEEAVIAYCRTQLTAYKVPKRIVFSAQLPKSPVGKILRAQLRAGQ